MLGEAKAKTPAGLWCNKKQKTERLQQIHVLEKMLMQHSKLQENGKAGTSSTRPSSTKL